MLAMSSSYKLGVVGILRLPLGVTCRLDISSF
jgi:hypothetical protein